MRVRCAAAACIVGRPTHGSIPQCMQRYHLHQNRYMLHDSSLHVSHSGRRYSRSSAPLPTRAAQQDLPADALEAPTLSPVANERQLDIEEAWLAEMIQTWQDEEWQPQDNHRELGIAVGKAYRRVRTSGEDDIGAILLAIASDLESFDFFDTFTSNFEVANKAMELLMSNDGQEVCCQGPDDARRLEVLGTAKARQTESDAA